MINHRIQAMQDRVQQVIAKAETLYNIKLSPQVLFDLRGKRAGCAQCSRCRWTGKVSNLKVRFNQQFINNENFQDMLDNTVPHELAHLVCYMRPDLGDHHDNGWRRVCMALGGNGNTRHDYKVEIKNGFTYRASCGTEVTVSRVIHTKIQAGSVRVFKKTRGRIDRYCAWAPVGQTLPAVPQMRKVGEMVIPIVYRHDIGNKPAETPAAPAVERKVLVAPVIPAKKAVRITKDGELTWAEKVRCLIREHKTLGNDINKVIELAILDLGMTRDRARSCVKAHWNKV